MLNTNGKNAVKLTRLNNLNHKKIQLYHRYIHPGLHRSGPEPYIPFPFQLPSILRTMVQNDSDQYSMGHLYHEHHLQEFVFVMKIFSSLLRREFNLIFSLSPIGKSPLYVSIFLKNGNRFSWVHCGSPDSLAHRSKSFGFPRIATLISKKKVH